VPFMLVHNVYPVHGIIDSVPKMYPVYMKHNSGDIPALLCHISYEIKV
jgi:hypothetical protein